VNECLGADIPIEEVETLEEKRLMQELRKRAEKENGRNDNNTRGNSKQEELQSPL
jgi:hypothetical protein